jgi:hypothetical protein
VDPVAALAADQKATVLILITVIAAPIAGYLFARSAEAWRSIGKGPFSIEQELPFRPRHLAAPSAPLDRVAQEQEVRQMLEAKAARLRERGAPPLDVEAETARLLAPAEDPGTADPDQDATLRDEVRSLVLVRNERRMRKGLEPLDVEAETERQLGDFIGLGT